MGMSFTGGAGPRARLGDVEFVDEEMAGDDVPIDFDFVVVIFDDSFVSEFGGGEAAAVRFCGICGATSGDGGAEGTRRLPSDCVD